MLSWLGGFSLWATRWRIVGRFPDVNRAVLIVAPHASTWDLFVGLAALFDLGLRVSFLGKQSLFRGLLGAVLRWLGGLPVDRSSSRDVVGEVAAQIREADALLLALAPEGTRKRVERWRTGFYQIALQAAVPIVPVALDYEARRIRVGEPIEPSGDLERDRRKLEAFYGELTGPIVF